MVEGLPSIHRPKGCFPSLFFFLAWWYRPVIPSSWEVEAEQFKVSLSCVESSRPARKTQDSDLTDKWGGGPYIRKKKLMTTYQRPEHSMQEIKKRTREKT